MESWANARFESVSISNRLRALTATKRSPPSASFLAIVAAASLLSCRQLSWAQPPASPSGASQNPSCDRKNFRVALDVGHDRIRPGATSARGVTEHAYNRELARSVLQALRATGFNDAFVVEENDEPLALMARPALARARNAKLFISLHHDSVQRRYLSSWTFQGRMLQYSDTFHGYSIFISEASKQAKENLALASDLGHALRAEGLTPSLHHAERIPGEGRKLIDPSLGIYQFDELAVLRGATMPALLLESAIIVNRDEEAAIQSGQYHPKVVTAIVHAVSQFCGNPQVLHDGPAIPGGAGVPKALE